MFQVTDRYLMSTFLSSTWLFVLFSKLANNEFYPVRTSVMVENTEIPEKERIGNKPVPSVSVDLVD